MYLKPGRAATFAVAFLCLHTTVWTLYASLSNGGPVHRDMIEAYSWGREFQLGYYKHPPLWAWIAGAWFEVFPRSNWAFYLLANLNSGIAVLGVWQLAGLFTRGVQRLNATLLLLLLPFYTIQGHQFNANYMQLSLWPWTVYFFVLSMETRRLRDGLAFGVLAAAGLLSKYYSAILLLSCFAASFWHPDWRRYYRSPAPYAALGACALLFAPHLWWLANHDFAPLKYVEEKTDYAAAQIYLGVLTFILGCVAFNLLGTALAVLSGGRGRRSAEADCAPISPNYVHFVAILALGPFVLTVVTAIAGHVKLSTNFAAPIFFLAPLLLIQTLKPAPARLRRWAGGTVAALYAGALFAGPAIPLLLSELNRRAPYPIIEVSREATRMWSDVTGLPLRVAAGAEMYALGTSFYSGQDTSAFLSFDFGHSPWITPASLAETGFLGICDEADETCHKRAVEFGGPGMREGHILLTGHTPRPVSLRLFVSPPKGRGAAASDADNVVVK